MSLPTSITALFYALLLTLGMLNPAPIEVTGVPEKAVEDVRIVSFNLRTKDDIYGSVDTRSEYINETIKAYHPDSFGVQECTKKWMKILETKLPEYAHVGEIRGSGTNDEYSAVFYLKDKYDLVETGTIWLSKTPDKPGSMSWGTTFPRIATWATLKNKDSGFVYTHINTHLNHIGQDIRYKQAEVLMRKADELNANNPVVITGDFNSQAKEKAYKLVASKYDDTRLVASETEDKTTFHDYGRKLSKNVIDFIFVTQNTNVSRYKVIDNMFNGMYMSDHNALAADISF